MGQGKIPSGWMTAQRETLFTAFPEAEPGKCQSAKQVFQALLAAPR